MGTGLIFNCTLCEKVHISTETIEHSYNGKTYPGVAKVPETLISLRNAKQEYFLKCTNACRPVGILVEGP